MPLDDLSLELRPALADAGPPLEVMTRVLRLPTHSVRQARAIVRLQLDRLSPVPPTEVLLDVVRLRLDGAEGVFGLGLLRRAVLRDPAFASRRTITARRTLDGVDATFRFRNAAAAPDWEARWLARAPRAALVLLGVAGVMLAGQLRADQWRERRLPEIAAAQRAATVQARTGREQQAAQAEWLSLERTDAATRLLCVASRIGSALPGGVSLTAASATSDRVTLGPAEAAGVAALAAAGGEAVAPDGASPSVVFPAEVCR